MSRRSEADKGFENYVREEMNNLRIEEDDDNTEEEETDEARAFEAGWNAQRTGRFGK